MQLFQTFLSLISPIAIEWMISFLVQMILLVIAPGILEDAILYTMVISLTIIPVMAWMYRRDCKRKEWKSENPITWVTILAVAMLGVSACLALNVLISVVGLAEYSEKYQQVAEIIYDAPKILQVFSIVIVAPIVEELVYRGLIYRRMRTFGPVIPAVFISAMIFGINHGNLVQGVFAFGIGCLLALSYEEYREIGIPIILHMAVNFTSLISTWMAG